MMRHYRAKLVNEAVQLDHTKLHSKLPGWFFDAYKEGEITYNKSKDCWIIHSQKAYEKRAWDGDYVVRNEFDAIDIISSDIFEVLKKYFEEVTDEVLYG